MELNPFALLLQMAAQPPLTPGTTKMGAKIVSGVLALGLAIFMLMRNRGKGKAE